MRSPFSLYPSVTINLPSGPHDNCNPAATLHATGLDSVQWITLPRPAVLDSSRAVPFIWAARPLPFPHWPFG